MKYSFLIWFSLSVLYACGTEDVKPRTVPQETPVVEPVKKEANLTPKEPQKPVAPKIIHEPALARTATDLSTSCTANLSEVRKIRDEILAVSGERTVENTLELYNKIRILLERSQSSSELLQEVHPDEALRKAAEQCTADAKKLLQEIKLDRGIYQALLAVSGIADHDNTTVRFRDFLLREYRLAGVDKDDAARVKLMQLQEEQTRLGQEFMRNIRESRTIIEFTPAELDGLPEDYIKAHPVNAQGKVEISTDAPDFFPLVTYAKSEAVRSRMYTVYLSRAGDKNEEVLRRLLSVRYQIASLLGFEDYASYNAVDKMVRDRKTIADFIEKVVVLARTRMQDDLRDILAAKKQDVRNARTVEVWDRFYYVRKIQQERFGVNAMEVRSYFNVNKVKQGLLKLAEDLFDIQFKRIFGATTWHESVEVYDVLEKGEPFARIYLDLYPRPNKYGHAAVFPIYSGVSSVQHPSAALVTNFPIGDNANMEYTDVVTFFHEFGHLLHHISAWNHRWITQSGFNCEWDFVEVPSQLFEEWARDATVLARFAVHPKTAEPIPADLVRKLNAATEFGKGVHVMRQMFYAALSLTLHTIPPEKLNLAKVLADVQKKYNPYPLVKGTSEYANFGHLVEYSSMYYTYMWSLVIVKDLFNRFREKGLLDAKTAKDYRQFILAAGGSMDAHEMVKNFLGRPYSFDSYQKWLTAR